MSKGGARNRSGPPPDPNSARSDARGYTLAALPNEGYAEKAPEFPLPRIVRWNDVYENGKKHRETDSGATDAFRERELDIWAESWKTPQACAWSLESWRWPTIAEFCRLKAVVEMEPDANAALVAQLHRFRDQIGLTPAGLRENGWAIAPVQVGPAAPKPATPKRTSSRDRLKSIPASGA